jgi:hypothetical protein
MDGAPAVAGGIPTLTVVLNGTSVLSLSYNIQFVGGVNQGDIQLGLLALNGSASFYGLTIRGDDPAYAGGGTPQLAATPPAIPAGAVPSERQASGGSSSSPVRSALEAGLRAAVLYAGLRHIPAIALIARFTLVAPPSGDLPHSKCGGPRPVARLVDMGIKMRVFRLRAGPPLMVRPPIARFSCRRGAGGQKSRRVALMALSRPARSRCFAA